MEPVTGFLKTFGIGGIIMILLGIAYKLIPEASLSDRPKTLIAAGVGMIAGLIFLFYNAVPIAFASVADHVFYGIKEGLTAIGLFKVLQAVGVFTPPGLVPPPAK